MHLWADGIYVIVRCEEWHCLSMVVGCDVRDRKHFQALEAHYRFIVWLVLAVGRFPR